MSNGESWSENASGWWRLVLEQGTQLLLTIISYALFTAGGLAVYMYSRASSEMVELYGDVTVRLNALAIAGAVLMLIGVGLGIWNLWRVRRRSKENRVQRRENRE